MCESMADIQSPTAEIRRGKKKRRTNDRIKIYMAIMTLSHSLTVSVDKNIFGVSLISVALRVTINEAS